MIICILCLLFVYLLIQSDSKFQFLGNELSYNQWQNLNQTLNCWNQHGYWNITNNTNIDITNYPQDFDSKENYHAGSHICYKYYLKYHSSIFHEEPLWNIYRNQCTTDSLFYTYDNSWSKEKICSILHGKNIMIVGDSISTQVYQTFLLMNTGDTSLNIIPCPIYHDNISVYFKRNDFLFIEGITILNTSVFNGATVNGQEEWAPFIHHNNISLLLLNRGAHYVEDFVLAERLQTVFHYLTVNCSNVTIIYRNTPIGHPQCCDHKPIDWFSKFNVDPLSGFHVNIQNPAIEHKLISYHWSDFPKQNNLTKSIIDSYFPQIIYFDVESLTNLRSDHHSCHRQDCLHYCFHSVIDSWIIHWLNLIQFGLQLSRGRRVTSTMIRQ